MARTRGNSDQEAGLRKLLSALGAVRKFADVRYKTVLAPTELLVKFDRKRQSKHTVDGLSPEPLSQLRLQQVEIV